MELLGIDLGSSSIKGAVLDVASRQLIRIVRAPFPDRQRGLPPGRFEVAPAEILRAATAVLEDLLAHSPGCAGILITGQMGGVVLVGPAGETLSPAISWRDQRALEPFPQADGTYLDVVRQRIGENDQERLGHEVNSSTAASLLFWLAEQRQLPRRAVPLSIPGYVLHSLCGELCQGFSEAIGTLDLESRRWHDDVFEKLGLPELSWPKLADVDEPVGSYAWRGRVIPCYAPVGDHQCALLGALLQKEELSINVSTGSQVSLLTEGWHPGKYQTRCYFGGEYVNTITRLPAGRALNVLVDLLCELPEATGSRPVDPWDYILSAAEAAPDDDLAIELSFFTGVSGARGSITNIGSDNLTVGGLFRAAFRAMAQTYQREAARLSPQRAWQKLVFSGGLIQKNPLLRQFIVDRFAVPYRVCDTDEETLQGLLLLAMVATGTSNSLAAAMKEFRPESGR